MINISSIVLWLNHRDNGNRRISAPAPHLETPRSVSAKGTERLLGGCWLWWKCPVPSAFQLPSSAAAPFLSPSLLHPSQSQGSAGIPQLDRPLSLGAANQNRDWTDILQFSINLRLLAEICSKTLDRTPEKRYFHPVILVFKGQYHPRSIGLMKWLRKIHKALGTLNAAPLKGLTRRYEWNHQWTFLHRNRLYSDVQKFDFRR